MNKIRKFTLISIPLLALFLILLIFSNFSYHELSIIFRNIPNYFSNLGNNSYSLPNREIDVLKYDLEIEIFNNENSISENARIFIKTSRNDRKEIELDLYDGFKINSVKVNKKDSRFDYANDKIKVFNNFIAGDTTEIEINFEGTPQNLGIGSFWNENKDGKQFLATLNEPIYASTWFPCNDTPNDKALTTISITNDSNLVSLSNGKLLDVIYRDKKNTYIWKSSYPIATYLISIYSGEYETFSQKYFSELDTMDVDYYVTLENFENAKIDFANHPNYIKVFSELFGEYPFIKEKYAVAEILWQQGAMESQTITGIGGNFISGKNFNEAILIHEVAHHWWGNSVTPKTWNDIWLNEGFSTYSEALYFEKMSGKDALISTMLSFKNQISSTDNQNLYSPGANIFSSTVYNKGAWVLHMLRKEIGDSLFFDGLRKYYNSYRYSNVSTDDMKHTFESVLDNNLDKFFNQWVYKGEGFLELDISTNEQIISDSVVIKINIKQKQDGYQNYHFPIDIQLEDSSGFLTIDTPYITADTTLTYNLKNRVMNIVFDKDNWLLADIFYNSTN